MVHKSTLLSNGGGGGGTVTQINTGTGLTGGPITGSGTISVANSTANSLAGYDGTGTFSDVTVGSGLILASGILTATSGGGGTVTSVSVVTANGVSGTVATATTTPAITLVLGAITPSSVASTGSVSGSNLSGTNTGDQTITLTGDVTGSGTGSFAATIGTNKVTYAKMQQASTHTLLGNPTGSSANISEITLGSGLSFSGTTLTATGTGGTVTSVSVSGANGIGVSGSPITTSGTIALTLGAITPSSVAATGNVTGANLSGTNTGDQVVPVNTTATTSNYFTAYNSSTGAFTKAQPAFTDISGTASPAQLPLATTLAFGAVKPDGTTITISSGVISAVGGGSGTVTTTGTPASGNLTKFSGSTSITNGDLSGDVTTSGALATTLATVNTNTGSFGSSTSIPNFTVNGKGLITAAGSNVVIAPAGTLTGTTLAANVVTSSLTTVGTIATGVWQGNKIGLAFGGTNADLSATGGASQVLKQVTSGAAITVAQLAASDISNGTTGSGAIVLATAPTMTNPVVGTQSSTDNSTKAASTAYVTSAISTAIAGINPAVAVQAATTQASNTSGLTYNNGVSGIGATFTGSNNTAIAFDGFTFTALGQRALIKNDTQSPSGAFNGVYYVTQIQTTILPPILTRALDYDQPSDINNTGAIPVVNGTLNASTSWLLTSSVASVGTDPLTYTEFSINPTTIQTTTLTNTHIWVGNASNIAADVAMSGDATITNTGAIAVTKINGTALGTTTATSGNILVGSGTQWVTQSVSGSGATIALSSTGVITISAIANASLSNSSITIAGTSTALGGTITQDTITGLASTGIVKRTGANTLAIATSGTDYCAATSGSSVLKGNSGNTTAATAGTDYVAPGTVTAFTAQQYFSASALTFSGTIAWNLTTAQAATITATSNIPFTLSNPSNLQSGGTYTLIIKQFSTGGQVITWSSAYKFPGGTKFTLSTGANAVDIVTFLSDGTNMYAVGQANFS